MNCYSNVDYDGIIMGYKEEWTVILMWTRVGLYIEWAIKRNGLLF